MSNQRDDVTPSANKAAKSSAETTSDMIASASRLTEVIEPVNPSKPDDSSAPSDQTSDFIAQPDAAGKVGQTADLKTQTPADPCATIDQVPTAGASEKHSADLAAPSSTQTCDFIAQPAAATGVDQTVDLVPTSPVDPAATIDQIPAVAASGQGTLDFVENAQGDGTLDFVDSAHSSGSGTPVSIAKVSVFDSKGSGGSGNWPTVTGYQIIGELGRGGMGVVYKARQRGLHRLVALKMILAGAHAGELQLTRFNIEAEAVARLQHPNIVQIHEIGEQDGLPYFSLEFVDGGPLDKKITGKPQPPREAALMIETLARAMHFAHQQGIIHRDLKPANILMTQSGVPKITDFGLAKRLEEGDSSQTKSGTIMGTPSYMAPEQARGDIHKVGPLSDLYSLGAILYELLTGRPPFRGANAMDTVIQVTRNEPVPPARLQPKTPGDLETICLKCLQKDPAKRYKDCFELADDLHRFLAGELILARPVGSVERLWRWCKRNPAGTTILLLLFFGLIGSIYAAIAIQAKKELAEQNEQKAKDSKELAELNEQKAKVSEQKAKDSEKIAIENEQKAIKSETIAAKQADLALNTLGLLINKVQSQLGRQPAMQELKNELLQTAMNGLKQVTGGAAGKVRRTTMDAFFRMGEISRELGNTEDFNKYRQLYYEHAKAALTDNPGNERLKLEMAWACRFQSEVCIGKGDLEKALTFNQSALELRKELAAVPVAERLRRNANLAPEDRINPRVSELQVSEEYTRIGYIYYSLGDSAKAVDPVLKGLAIRENLVNEYARDQAVLFMAVNPMAVPTVLSTAGCMPVQFDQSNGMRKDLTRIYHLAGELYFRLRNLEQSRIYYQKCEDIRESILHDEESVVERMKQIGRPQPPDFRLMGDLAEFHQMYGNKLFSLGAPLPEVLTHIDRSIALNRRVLELDKAVGTRQNLAKSLYSRGVVAVRAGDRATAAKCFEECLEIREGLVAKDVNNYANKLDLLEVLARSGKHERATQLAEKLRPEHQKDSAFQICLARAYVQCSVSVPAKSELQRKYAEMAIAAVKTALEQGYKDVITLETNPDLDPIRENAEFKKLLEKVSKPAPPTQ